MLCAGQTRPFEDNISFWKISARDNRCRIALGHRLVVFGQRAIQPGTRTHVVFFPTPWDRHVLN